MLTVCLGWIVDRMANVDGGVLTCSGVGVGAPFHQLIESIEKVTILTSWGELQLRLVSNVAVRLVCLIHSFISAMSLPPGKYCLSIQKSSVLAPGWPDGL